MAKLLSVRQIVEDALRKIGSYAPHHTGADPDEFSIGMRFFETLASEVMATEKPLWAVQENVICPIPAATNPIDPVSILGPSVISSRSFMMLDDVRLVNITTNQDMDPLDRLSRAQYQAIQDRARAGRPEAIYVDRTEYTPRFYLYPVQPTALVYSLSITFWKYAPAYTATGAHGFPEAWQRYLITELAADLGSGPVLHLEETKIDRFRRDAANSRALLQGRHEKESLRNRRVRNNDMY